MSRGSKHATLLLTIVGISAMLFGLVELWKYDAACNTFDNLGSEASQVSFLCKNLSQHLRDEVAQNLALDRADAFDELACELFGTQYKWTVRDAITCCIEASSPETLLTLAERLEDLSGSLRSAVNNEEMQEHICFRLENLLADCKPVEKSVRLKQPQ